MKIKIAFPVFRFSRIFWIRTRLSNVDLGCGWTDFANVVTFKKTWMNEKNVFDNIE